MLAACSDSDKKEAQGETACTLSGLAGDPVAVPIKAENYEIKPTESTVLTLTCQVPPSQASQSQLDDKGTVLIGKPAKLQATKKEGIRPGEPVLLSWDLSETTPICPEDDRGGPCLIEKKISFNIVPEGPPPPPVPSPEPSPNPTPPPPAPPPSGESTMEIGISFSYRWLPAGGDSGFMDLRALVIGGGSSPYLYNWKFLNTNTQAVGEITSLPVTKGDTYRVELTVTDSRGDTRTKTKSIQVCVTADGYC
ncbi:MAG: PKD domain-containing protein [Deltaproteobacteria bacterium]|nr:PKD domain-containing protein [Deltaproteobacteria bacterium]